MCVSECSVDALADQQVPAYAVNENSLYSNTDESGMCVSSVHGGYAVNENSGVYSNLSHSQTLY